MTQQPLAFGRPPSLTDRLEQHFRAHVGQPVHNTTIAEIVGVAGCRERRRHVEMRGLELIRHEYTDANGHEHLTWTFTGRIVPCVPRSRGAKREAA